MPINRTIPEYVFRSPSETASTPDWSRPVEAETASRVLPAEKRQIPPVDYTAPKLEVPRPKDPEQRPTQKFLAKRKTPSKSLPQPAKSPGRLSRPRLAENAKSAPWSQDNPEAPEVQAEQSARASMKERSLDSPSASQRSAQSASVAATRPRDLPDQPSQAKSADLTRSRSLSMPDLKVSQIRQRQPQSIRTRFFAAGSSPSTASVAIRRQSASADLLFEPVDAVRVARAATNGADLSMANRNGLRRF